MTPAPPGNVRSIGGEEYPQPPGHGERATARPPRARFDAAFTAGFPKKMRRAGGLVFPKETGALAQILVVLGATLVATQGRISALLLAGSALALFFAHEPFMIVTGLRGPRARHESSAVAWRQLVAAPVLAIAAAIAGLALAPSGTAWAILVPVLPALVLTPLVFGRLEKTLEGELLVALTLAGFSFPVALAGGLSVARAAALASIWVTALGTATLSVRRVTARAKSAVTPAKRAAPLVSGLLCEGLLALLAATGILPASTPLAPVPVLLFSFYIAIWPPHLRHIRKVGWTLALCLLFSSVLAVSAVR